jgi:2-haloacid dehalogenase
VATHDWNENQDAGYPIAKATEELVAQHPEWEKEIKAYYGRWEEMLGGPIHETVEIFKQLKQIQGLKIYALTNWSAETFHIALARYDFLHWFDGRVVSGDEKTRKPFHEFYQRLLERYNVDPKKALFIDDNLRNVKAAEELGIKGIHFIDPGKLAEQLKALNLIN